VPGKNKVGPGKYHVRLGLKSFDLPDSDYQFNGQWFSILPCPNRLIPVVSSPPDDTDWELPENIDDRYPTCEFYMDIPFTTTEPLDHKEIYERGMDRALWITSLMRLYQAGDLFAYVYDITGTGITRGLRVGPFIFLSLHANPQAPRYSPYYLDNRDDVEAMAAFVDHNIGIDWSSIRLPLDRLSTYYKRSWGADLVIDLMIILESLFTHGHENISYQVRLKTAAFLKGTEEISRLQRTPEDIFNFIRKAYDARSDIVHGGSKAMKWMSGEFKSPSLTRHNVSELEEIVRSCLRVTLNWMRQGKSVSPGHLDRQLFLT
jgi:hypothetical protein